MLDRSNSASAVTTSSSDPIRSLAWWPDGRGLRFTTEDAFATKLSSVSLAGSVRSLYQFPGRARLQDVAQDGAMLVTVYDFQSHLEVSAPAQAVREIPPGSIPRGSRRSRRTEGWFCSTTGPPVPPPSCFATSRRSNRRISGRASRSRSLRSQDRGDALARSLRGAARPHRTRDHGTSSGLRAPLQEEVGAWSGDGKTLWFTARPSGQMGVHLHSIEIATRKLLGPYPGVEMLPDTPIALSPDEARIAVTAPDRGISVHTLLDGRAVRITSIPPVQRPVPAGWATDDELWVCVRGATPPKLVRVNVRTGQYPGSRNIELRHGGHHEVTDARISRDGSVMVVQYFGARARLELMRGIPADR